MNVARRLSAGPLLPEITMHKRIIPLIIAGLLFGNVSLASAADAAKPAKKAAAKAAAPDESQETVQLKLNSYAQRHVRTMTECLKPGENSKAVEQEGSEFVARYRTVDPSSGSTDVHPGSAGAKFIGLLVYHEVEYENRAPSREVALNGPFVAVKTRKVTEILRYDRGKGQ